MSCHFHPHQGQQKVAVRWWAGPWNDGAGGVADIQTRVRMRTHCCSDETAAGAGGIFQGTGAANDKRTNKEPEKQLKKTQGEYAPSHRASTPPTPHAAVTSGPLEVGSWWLHARPGNLGEETQGAVFALMGLIN